MTSSSPDTGEAAFNLNRGLCLTPSGQVVQLLPQRPQDAGPGSSAGGPRAEPGLGRGGPGASGQTHPRLLLLRSPRADAGRPHRVLPLQLPAGPAHQGECELRVCLCLIVCDCCLCYVCVL